MSQRTSASPLSEPNPSARRLVPLVPLVLTLEKSNIFNPFPKFSPKEEPVVGDGQVEDLGWFQAGVDHTVLWTTGEEERHHLLRTVTVVM